VCYVFHRSRILDSQDLKPIRKLSVGVHVFIDLVNPNLLDVCGTVSYLPPEGILAMDNHKLGYVSTRVPTRSTHERSVPGWDALRLLECWSDAVYHARVRHSFWTQYSMTLNPLRVGATTPLIFREEPLVNPGGPPPTLHHPRRTQSPKHATHPKISPNPSANLPRPPRQATVWSRSALSTDT
jgi:hypothetical protein